MDPKSGDIFLPADLIRTVGIVLVILLHAAIESYPIPIVQMSQEEVVRWWAVNVYDSIGRFGIPLFVMLCGTLLLQPSKSNEPFGVFFKRRLNRIGLPFLFWGVAYFAWRFFVNHEALSLNSIVQGILNGPYTHFWFLYLLLGLYLVTPVFRVLVAHASWKVLTYLLLLWFLGTTIMHLMELSGVFALNGNVFLMTGWLGYFLLGIYLPKARVRRLVLYSSLLLGLSCTIFGTYVLVGSAGEQFSQFFYDAFSANVILGSVALFLILSSNRSSHLEKPSSPTKRLLHLIGQNTLPIYLFHIMILETLQKGYLGFQISIMTINPMLEVPLITVITLFICLAIIVSLKKIPLLRKLIG